MLRRWISKLMGTTLYVQIWATRIKVTDVRSRQVFDDSPLVAIRLQNNKHLVLAVGSAARQLAADDVQVVNPFLHPRVLFSDFPVGETLLKEIFRKLIGTSIWAPSPAVVIHPMEKTEGGLTMIERRAFMELALGAGARHAEVYEGTELPIEGFEEILKVRTTSRS